MRDGVVPIPRTSKEPRRRILSTRTMKALPEPGSPIPTTLPGFPGARFKAGKPGEAATYTTTDMTVLHLPMTPAVWMMSAVTETLAPGTIVTYTRPFAVPSSTAAPAAVEIGTPTATDTFISTTTVTSTITPTPTTSIADTCAPALLPVPQNQALCAESKLLEAWSGWSLDTSFGYNRTIRWVDWREPTILTITNMFDGRPRYVVKVDDVIAGISSPPTLDEDVSCMRGNADDCIQNGSSWGQWVIPAGQHSLSVTILDIPVIPTHTYFMYKRSIC